MSVSDEAVEAARAAYYETLTNLRLKEGGGFKVSSQVNRSLRAALEAAAPHMLAAAWDEAISAHIAWTWDDENIDPLINPYRHT